MQNLWIKKKSLDYQFKLKNTIKESSLKLSYKYFTLILDLIKESEVFLMFKVHISKRVQVKDTSDKILSTRPCHENKQF